MRLRTQENCYALNRARLHAESLARRSDLPLGAIHLEGQIGFEGRGFGARERVVDDVQRCFFIEAKRSVVEREAAVRGSSVRQSVKTFAADPASGLVWRPHRVAATGKSLNGSDRYWLTAGSTAER